MPCRSGSPHGVISAAADDDLPDTTGVWLWAVISVGCNITSTDAATTDAPIDCRSRLRISFLPAAHAGGEDDPAPQAERQFPFGPFITAGRPTVQRRRPPMQTR